MLGISGHGVLELVLEPGMDMWVGKDVIRYETKCSSCAGRPPSEENLGFLGKSLVGQFRFRHIAVDDVVEEGNVIVLVYAFPVVIQLLPLGNGDMLFSYL